MEENNPMPTPAPAAAPPNAVPPVTVAPTPATPAPPPDEPSPAPQRPTMAEGGEVEKANWKFGSKDLISIIFFSGGIAAFFVAVHYFRSRRKMLISWQTDINDDLAAIKGKVKTLENKTKTAVTQAKNNVANW